MIDLTTSRQSMSLLSLAAYLAAFAFVLSGIAYVAVSASGSSTSQDFATAAGWVLFAGFTGAFVAVAPLAWGKLQSQGRSDASEPCGAAAATLLLAIGFLVSATHPTGPSTAGEVLAAVGFGGWSVLFAVKGARRAQAERGPSESAGYSRLLFAVSGSLFLIAIGTGLPAPAFGDVGPGVAGQILTAIGLVGISTVLVAARSRGLIALPQPMVVGLLVLVLGFLAYGVVAVFILTSTTGSLTTYRVGLSLPTFVTALGFGLVGLTALRRSYEIAPARVPVSGSATGVVNA